MTAGSESGIRLSGKVALVTGGARGLGREIAASFIRAGALTYISDVTPQAGAQTARDLGAAGSFVHDIADEQAWGEVLAAILARSERLDILVNNAGIARLPEGNALETFSVEAWRKVVDVNGLGTALGCKHGFAAMKDTGGVIVNMASIVSSGPSQGIAAYGFSKAGILQLTKSMAELGAPHGVRCNAVQPGMILTPMLQDIQGQYGDGSREAFRARIPLGGYQTEADIAAGVLFLASDEARSITGAQLVIDGGLTL